MALIIWFLALVAAGDVTNGAGIRAWSSFSRCISSRSGSLGVSPYG
jgi:hypothetical protein